MKQHGYYSHFLLNCEIRLIFANLRARKLFLEMRLFNFPKTFPRNHFLSSRNTNWNGCNFKRKDYFYIPKKTDLT
jgi:hypothetical protein